jgi:hypothetical protein
VQEGVPIYKTNQAFWACYQNLPREIQQRADKSFGLLNQNPKHPSLNFKKVGKKVWSVRISRDYRALAREDDRIFVWYWIGKHDEYMRRIRHQDI